MNPLPTTNARVVVAYLRTSSAEQGRAYGPDAQRRAIHEFARREGLDIVAELREDISGTTPLDERPGLSDALSAVYQHGAGGLLVAERTRLARDEYVAHDAIRAFRAAGCRVLYADSSNGDDDSFLLMDGIGHAIAAHDRRLIVARLKAGREAKNARHGQARAQAQGGRLPHGYRRQVRTGLVEIDATTAAEVRQAFELARRGASVRDIAAAVDLPKSVVGRMLREPLYKAAEPGRIVDPRVWNAVQETLGARRSVSRDLEEKTS